MSTQGMRVTLEGTLAVHQFDAFAELGWLEARPEVAALCRAAMSGASITPEVIEATLPGLSRRAMHNVRAWLAELGVCAHNGDLTDMGRQTAATGDVPIPEQGVYRLWVVEHPLTGRRVLHAARQAPATDHRFNDITPLPVQPELDFAFGSVVDPKTRIVVRRFPSNHGAAGCLPQGDGSALTIRWDWDMDAGRECWTVAGRLDVGSRAEIHPIEESAGDDPWVLLARLGREAQWPRGRWNDRERALFVRFEEANAASLETFRGDYAVKVGGVPGFETYTRVKLHGAPLRPADATTAQTWAEQRLARRLEKPKARSRDAVRQLWADQVEGTPLERHAPRLPTHAALLKGAAKHPGRYWALAAPVDLAPVPPSADDLGEMSATAATVESAATPIVERSAVRIPYGSRWSLRTLIDRLFPAGGLERVILLDRYVRGTSNLAALTALTRAVQDVGAALQVCTDHDGRGVGVQAINTITGTKTQTYARTFGRRRRSHPHDRYLIGVTASTVEVWQLSNSPLDGRWSGDDPPTPDTPLRWRDLAATRCELDQLPPGFTTLARGAS